MRFLNSVTVPKNVKGVLQNIEINERGTLWCNPKNFKKKSHSAEKKVGLRWDL